MKIINFGSLNIDMVYQVEQFVNPGQTIFAREHNTFSGGKGLNQSIAAARAGASVLHAGAIGQNGQFLIDMLNNAGVDTSNIMKLDAPTGHAIIEVNNEGQNRIIVFGSTNQMLTEEYIAQIIAASDPDDIVLLQNETNLIDHIISCAHHKGLKVAFNPSPMPENLSALPLQYVDYFMVNEIEGAQLASACSDASFDDILNLLGEKYPDAGIIMTLGHNGVIYKDKNTKASHPIFKVQAVDTTAAGDTFSGYFLSALCAGRDINLALKEASAASAIAVSRSGAAPSIPAYQEVLTFIASREV